MSWEKQFFLFYIIVVYSHSGEILHPTFYKKKVEHMLINHELC